MKRFSPFILCCFFYSWGFSQTRDIPPNAEPGKCYTKCLILPKWIEQTEDYFIYTGANPIDVNLEETEIVIEEARSTWAMNKKWKMAPIDLPAVTRSVILVKDTSQTKEYIIEAITVLRLENRPQRSEWREILCHNNDNYQKIMTLQQTLKEKGFYIEEVNGQIDFSTKQALRIYQTLNDLPVGHLDRETFESLGIL